MEEIKEKNIELQDVQEFLSVSGRGVKGKIDGVNYYGGNLSFMKENNINTVDYEEKVTQLSSSRKNLFIFCKRK